MLTLADKGGGGLANADSTAKNALKRAKVVCVVLNSSLSIGNFAQCIVFSWYFLVIQGEGERHMLTRLMKKREEGKC